MYIYMYIYMYSTLLCRSCLYAGYTENFENAFEGTNTNPGSLSLAILDGYFAYKGWSVGLRKNKQTENEPITRTCVSFDSNTSQLYFSICTLQGASECATRRDGQPREVRLRRCFWRYQHCYSALLALLTDAASRRVPQGPAAHCLDQHGLRHRHLRPHQHGLLLGADA